MLFQYKVAQLWSVAETSQKETGGGSVVEILKKMNHVKKVCPTARRQRGTTSRKFITLESKC